MQAPAGSESGIVSDFDDGTTTTRFGAGWSVSNDAMAGGKSSAEMVVVDGGAEGSAKSLAIRGTISDAFKQAWAGAMFSPGKQIFQPANLGAKKEVRFWAKGDGKTYRVFIFAESKGYAPLTQTFVAGAEWKEYVFPLAVVRRHRRPRHHGVDLRRRSGAGQLRIPDRSCRVQIDHGRCNTTQTSAGRGTCG